MALCYKCGKEISYPDRLSSGFINSFKYLFFGRRSIIVNCKYCSAVNANRWGRAIQVLEGIFSLGIFVLLNLVFGKIEGIYSVIIVFGSFFIIDYLTWKYLITLNEFWLSS